MLQQPQETDGALKVPGTESGVGIVNRRVKSMGGDVM